MPFHVYVLKSTATGRFYTGSTMDLRKRLDEHATGVARYTRGRGPWQLVHSEEFETRSQAMLRERFLKTGRGREWIKSILAGDSPP